MTKSSRNHFPVVNEKQEFVGVIRLDDIRHIMFDTTIYEKVKASDLMHADAGIINIDIDNAQIIMKKFKTTGAWNLPVVKKGKYHGYISKSRLLTAYRRKLIHVTNT